ncbi:MAG: DNA mismatch repair endonuclease MutL [Pseudomonadota bacterium]|nr:DNA mismatch repair endonuclease MutL [Pseudomonadota bacterium]
MAVRILEEHLINKIAAGEVVERPASVVKELVENALDAGATSLGVHLRAGGRNLVRIVDDGSGMNRTDAVMCLERHATSKILHDDDLFRIATLGFRGEAIPSIASVSKFDLLTRQRDAEAGTHIRVEGGKLLDVSPAGAAPGTEVSVASLFFNVPARRKFLRSVETELGHCLEAVTREALIRPDLDLEVTHDDRTLLRCPPSGNRARRAADLLGAHGEALVPVSLSRGTLEVDALLSPVGVHRASPQGSSWLYVNGRYVRDLVLRRAVTAAYAGIVPKDRYPVVILEVRIPPEDVDVNVHPAKTEVRFVNGYALQNAITEGLRNALREHGIRRPVAVESRYQPAAAPPSAAQIGLGWTPPRSAEERSDAPRELDRDLERREEMPPRVFVSERPAEEVPEGWRPHTAEVPPWSAPDPGEGASERTAPAHEDLADAAAALRVATPGANAAPMPRATPIPPAFPVSAPPAVTPRIAAPPAPAPAPARPLPSDSLLPVARFRDLRVVGQLALTYVLCEGAGELVVIDQHAAHERVTLYKLMRDPRAALGGAQRLLVPVMIELPAARARLLAAQVDRLAPYGLDIAPMGGGSFAVQALPAALRDMDLHTLLADIADELAEGGGATAADDRLQLALATRACHTSVRAGQVLSELEMRALLVSLDEVDFSVCAHGRPVAIRVGTSELERRFHRA